jgi:D-alanyl-D-alanine carboxypeptidase
MARVRLDRDALASLDEHTTARMAESATPGVAIALTDATGLVHTRCLGYADLAARIPVGPDTRFGIGSVGKTCTAVALLSVLEQRGHVRLDDSVDRHLPWVSFPPGRPAPTLHQLLTHTGGLPGGGLGTAGSRCEMLRLRDMPLAAPGGRWAYSNLGYQLLGYVIEDLTGSYYDDCLAERVFRPAGMTATAALTELEADERLAVPYRRRPSGSGEAGRPIPLSPFGYAGNESDLSATVTDLAAFVRMLIRRDGPLTPAGWERMCTGHVQVRPGSRYGYGLYVYRIRGDRWVAHSGSVPGYKAMVLADLDRGLGAAVATNGPGDPTPLARHALDVLLAAGAGSAPPPPRPVAAPRPADGAVFRGEYAGPAGLLRIGSGPDGAAVVEVDGAPAPARRRGVDRCQVEHPALARYVLEAARRGDRTIALYHGLDRYDATDPTVEPPAGVAPELTGHVGHYRSYNPWLPEFLVCERNGALSMLVPPGAHRAMRPDGPGLFRLDGPGEVDYLRFGDEVGGVSLSCEYSGALYYRAPWSLPAFAGRRAAPVTSGAAA